MKIGFNVKKIINTFQESINYFSTKVVQNENNIANHETRITTLENSKWIEITSSNGQEAEITQEFSEIRMWCRSNTGLNYSVNYIYDSSIFPNTKGEKYFICGNPRQNNFGCSFKYKVTSDGKKYVGVNQCYNGADAIFNYTFKAWIKPKSNSV